MEKRNLIRKNKSELKFYVVKTKVLSKINVKGTPAACGSGGGLAGGTAGGSPAPQAQDGEGSQRQGVLCRFGPCLKAVYHEGVGTLTKIKQENRQDTHGVMHKARG